MNLFETSAGLVLFQITVGSVRILPLYSLQVIKGTERGIWEAPLDSFPQTR